MMPIGKKRKKTPLPPSENTIKRIQFRFADTVKQQAFFRQWNRCAYCGNSLVNVWDNAHHVIPVQSGNLNDPEDSFLKTVDNCVMLCEECHLEVGHSGNFTKGPVAVPVTFPYSHGQEKKAHQTWNEKVTKEWKRKFPEVNGNKFS